jgi:hypothetical protein
MVNPNNSTLREGVSGRQSKAPLATGTGAVDNILRDVKITQVYVTLTGKTPRRTGTDTARGQAVWREGDGFNVSLDDSRGVWHDFKTDEGGGVLDLVARIRGGGRQDALKWVAQFAGVGLDDRPLSPAEKQRWAEQRREVNRELPAARYWKRAAINMSEDLLSLLKARLFDPTPDPEDLSQPVELNGREIFDVEQMLSRLRRLDGCELTQEFTWWMEHHPGMTTGMIHAAQNLEAAEGRALRAYLAGVCE